MDFNSIPTGDWFIYSLSNRSHYPSGAQNGGRLICRIADTTSYQQYIEDGGKIYYRVKWYSNSWSDWSLVYDHNLLSNTSELSSLASALGVNSINYINGTIESGALIEATGHIGVIYAYTDNNETGAALFCYEHNSASYATLIIAKQEKGITIAGEWWDRLSLTSTSGNNIQYEMRSLL